MNLEIPDGLGDLLRDFTVAVLKERPGDLYDFAVDYFTKARDARKPKDVPMYIIVEDDDEAGEPDRTAFKPKSTTGRYARRQSVSAERYNPEEDEDDDDHIIYPKTDEQRERLTKTVSGILLFRSLEPEQTQQVIDAMFEKKVSPGETVIRQGDDGDNFYVIDNGIYDVLVDIKGEEKKVHQFDNRGSFGELALMYNMPRSATVRSVTDGTLWAMDRNSFRKIVLKSAFKKRKKYETLLESVNILQNLDRYERMTLADALVSRVYQDGEPIIRQGDDPDGVYFVEEGHIRITISSPDGTETDIGTRTTSTYFGELALIENKPRTANVYAVGKVKVAFLERDCFERLLGPCVEIMKRNSQQYTMFVSN
ncbi:cAMP-dependent protein kinase type II regulatory subunit [Biomphalaria pfeifferi]|uniref:cAMP-dependent protein kinase type II regulatory subunit n=1 Tax=Biomphalaria pfeifferi TaxID=112525 RepID=A0AAD8BG88_BIOPF|nr:cAMP-dependent protein kinase type II regulatory subunit [Biomphalaria pfeifferi]